MRGECILRNNLIASIVAISFFRSYFRKMVKTEIYTLKICTFARIPCVQERSVCSVPPLASFNHDADAEVERITRTGRQIQCTDTGLYLVGHYTIAGNTLSPEVWKFNYVRNRWSKVSRKRHDYCKRLAYCSSVLWGNMLLVYCSVSSPCALQSLYFGSLPKSETRMKFVEMKSHSVADDYRSLQKLLTFRKCDVSRSTRPHAYDGYSMAVNKEGLFMVGGLSRDSDMLYSMDVHMFCFRTREWKKLYDCLQDKDGPAPRYGHTMVYHDDQLYIFGGGTLDSNYSLEEIPAFDLKTNKWNIYRTIADTTGDNYGRYPLGRKLHACAPHPHQPSVIFINGGCKQPRADLPAFGDTWRIDLDTLKWQCIPSLTLHPGRFLHSMSSTAEGRLYLFEGSSNNETSYGNLFSAWITVPKLVHACWDAFLHYVRQGVIDLPEDLETLRLPKEYRDRLMLDDRLNDDTETIQRRLLTSIIE